MLATRAVEPKTAQRRPYLLTWIRRSRIFSSMINVTDNAVRQLQSLLSQRPENSQKGLRVQVAKGGCSGLHYEMTLGEREEGDAIVERDGVQFLIDDESVSYLRGDPGFHRWFNRRGFSNRQSKRVAYVRMRHVVRSDAVSLKPGIVAR